MAKFLQRLRGVSKDSQHLRGSRVSAMCVRRGKWKQVSSRRALGQGGEAFLSEGSEQLGANPEGSSKRGRRLCHREAAELQQLGRPERGVSKGTISRPRGLPGRHLRPALAAAPGQLRRLLCSGLESARSEGSAYLHGLRKAVTNTGKTALGIFDEAAGSG